MEPAAIAAEIKKMVPPYSIYFDESQQALCERYENGAADDAEAQLEQREQQLLGKHLELKDAQMAITKLEEHVAELGANTAAIDKQANSSVLELQQQLAKRDAELTEAHAALEVSSQALEVSSRDSTEQVRALEDIIASLKSKLEEETEIRIMALEELTWSYKEKLAEQIERQEKQTCTELIDERAKADEQISKLEEEIAAEKQLAVTQGQRTDDVNESLTQEIERLTADGQQKSQELLNKHLELKDAQMATTKLEEHVAELGASATIDQEQGSGALTDLTAQLAEAHHELQELEGTQHTVSEQAASQVEVLQTANTDLTTQLDQTARELVQKHSKLTDAQVAITKLEEHVAELRSNHADAAKIERHRVISRCGLNRGGMS